MTYQSQAATVRVTAGKLRSQHSDPEARAAFNNWAKKIFFRREPDKSFYGHPIKVEFRAKSTFPRVGHRTSIGNLSTSIDKSVNVELDITDPRMCKYLIENRFASHIFYPRPHDDAEAIFRFIDREFRYKT